MMPIETVEGDLLTQPVDVIVNAWNRNIIPYWLLIPHGISGAIKRRAGVQPFQELQQYGRLPLGAAVLTSAGRLPYQGIIHAVTVTLWGTTNEQIIHTVVVNVIALARHHVVHSLAFPLLGSGSGSMNEVTAYRTICMALQQLDYDGIVRIVRYRRSV
jgi:O-acetyl-ADP-ribose deacetylase (regulator of RNase III)